MELRELKSFTVAARLRSISKAADELGLVQPTVSMHIKKLEAELGMVLFDRVTRPIQLTLAGSTLAEMAVPLVEGIETLRARTTQMEEDGPVSVGAVSDIIPHALISVVREFRQRHPHAHLRIRSADTGDVIRMVAEGEVDLGIVSRPERSAEFDFEGLFGYERVVLAPLGHPLLAAPLTSLDQIAEWPLIMMRRGTHTRFLLESELERRGVSYDIIVELDNMDMIKRYVALGMGISVGPRLAIEPEDERELGILSLSHLLPTEQAGVVTLRGKIISTPAMRFIGVMKDVFATGSGG